MFEHSKDVLSGVSQKAREFIVKICEDDVCPQGLVRVVISTYESRGVDGLAECIERFKLPGWVVNELVLSKCFRSVI